LKKLKDKIKNQDRELGEQEEEIKAKEHKIENCEQMIQKIQKEQDICTLSARYSTNTIVVSWKLGENQAASESDWVGFFQKDSKNKQYLEYIKTGGERQGSYNFQTPKAPGLYEFRFFLKGSYTHVVTSGIINTGPSIELEAKRDGDKITCQWKLKAGDLSPKDWIGFYETSKSTRHYLSMHYIQRTTNIITVPAPRKPTNYEFRFVPHLANYLPIAKVKKKKIYSLTSLSKFFFLRAML